MTQQETQERNKEIALMLGKKYKDNWIVIHHNNVCGVNPTGETWQECLYHSDWNWLMEAVEFIENKGYDVVTAKQSCGVWTGAKCHIDGKGINKKEAVFTAISDFAKLYNEKKL